MAVTVLTWNLKGAKGVDVGRVVDHIAAAAADVVVLQEVQRGQARPIARRLGAASHRWAFKHWPIRTWPEGMAVIGVTEPAPARTHALTRRWAPWSWRRRVAQVASVALAGMPHGVTLVNVHLSAGAAASRRAAEADTVLGLVAGRGRPAIVAGDLNDLPGSVVHTRLTEGGLRDTWAALRGDEAGATNWRGWGAGTTPPPPHRDDHGRGAGRPHPVGGPL